jgi:hypothetical protein
LTSIPPEQPPPPFVIDYRAIKEPAPRGGRPGGMLDFAVASAVATFLLAVAIAGISEMSNSPTEDHDAAAFVCCGSISAVVVITSIGTAIAAGTRNCRYLFLGPLGGERGDLAYYAAGALYAVSTIASMYVSSLAGEWAAPLVAALPSMAVSAIVAGWFLVKRERLTV